MKKKVSVVIPCYNEEENIDLIIEAVEEQFKKLPQYDFEIIVIDNCSQDKSRELIEKQCQKKKYVKAIFNIRNFGGLNSPYYAILNSTGDCTIEISADFQEPPEMIPQFLEEWEKGYKVVCAVKNKVHENFFIKSARNTYYKLIKKFSEIDQIEHFVGFGLYDKSFVDIMKSLNDPTPFLRGIVAEYGNNRKILYYEQPKRKNGKSKYNLYNYYDYAMVSFTTYTKVGLRIASFFGVIVSIISFLIGIVYLIMKLTNWYSFSMGQAPILIGMFFLGALQIFFIGLLGEYIIAISERVKHRPLVIEEKRINF